MREVGRALLPGGELFAAAAAAAAAAPADPPDPPWGTNSFAGESCEERWPSQV